ncbi:hypothetical protein CK910_20805 [Aeromonas sp. CA23]|uniref:hypothetical protein n=1 Tax=Aeromonas sp. CA23 TaxID=2033032 RepID=UPI000BFE9D07|nr:hypothetical protein [Aeromonas sp. CA23]ATM00635.1 hypothetical protein CK910_20805 [Aeromonas sp. CA23]
MNESLLTQASHLFEKGGNFTLADVHALEQLEAQANGEECALIGELWEAAIIAADDEAFHYLTHF